MVTQWRFDRNNPYEDSFEEGLLRMLGSPHVFDVVKRKFVEILRNPKANHRGTVQGRVVYIAFTGPGNLVGGLDIEPLLLVYTLQERDKLIQRVFVCRAAEYVDDPAGATMQTMAPALRGAIARALLNAGAKKPH
jgi:hypothetical protein